MPARDKWKPEKFKEATRELEISDDAKRFEGRLAPLLKHQPPAEPK